MVCINVAKPCNRRMCIGDLIVFESCLVQECELNEVGMRQGLVRQYLVVCASGVSMVEAVRQ